jgi:hypothetical protein
MRKFNIWVVTLAALSLFVPAGFAFAGDADTNATGPIEALDANQGSGVQTNADDWENMTNVLAGGGSQTSNTGNDANTGSGTQDNSSDTSDNWSNIGNGNNGSGAQVLGSANSNGGDRTSSDIVMNLGDGGSVANSALESSVSGNAVTVSAMSASANSALNMDNGSGFSGMYGVNAIALSTGANSSQNVNVNVTASVDAGN